MFFSRWRYISSFGFLLPEVPLAPLENGHSASSAAALSEVLPGAFVVVACASGVAGALLLVSLPGTLGCWALPPCLESPALQAAAVVGVVGKDPEVSGCFCYS